MLGLAPSATKEGAKGPQNGPNGHGCQKGPKPSAGAKRRGTECPELLFIEEKYFNLKTLFCSIKKKYKFMSCRINYKTEKCIIK